MLDNELGSAWGGLSPALEEVRQVIDEHSINDLDRAEGYRHALRFLHFLIEASEFDDPLRPRFHQAVHETRKFFGDGADVRYDRARIDESLTYRITGDRGNIPYLSFVLYRKNLADRYSANLNDSDIDFAADGSFEIIVSPDAPGGTDGNWLKSDEGCNEVVARQYHKDPETEIAASYSIELVGEDPGPRPPLGADAYARQLDTLTRTLTKTITRVARLGPMLASSPNSLQLVPENMSGAFSGTPDNRYAIGWFELAEGEALELVAKIPDARYWGIQVFNRWFESLEYRDHVTSLNDAQVKREPDGSVRVLISATDPGEPTWIDTCGHGHGILGVRYLISESYPVPDVRVITL